MQATAFAFFAQAGFLVQQPDKRVPRIKYFLR